MTNPESDVYDGLRLRTYVVVNNGERCLRRAVRCRPTKNQLRLII
ncbi:hypothetical protein [Nostoc sp.]